MFIDETFLKIGRKTWYLIVVVSGNNKIMAVELVKKRTKAIIFEIVKNCADRLLYGLQLLISDGFQVYVGVARKLGKNLTHVRHIHKPPYRRIIVEIYSYDEFDVSKTIFKTTNEITTTFGWFIGHVKTTKESLGNRKRGRKRGVKTVPNILLRQKRKKRQKTGNLVVDLQQNLLKRDGKCMFSIMTEKKVG
ncbi:MAG: hypothetical protein K9W44_08830 [Candidatus Lokiarchaeota archaeon]|nr:hypothetical protein [Candidatus Harpocratesius repetitus]